MRAVSRRPGYLPARLPLPGAEAVRVWLAPTPARRFGFAFGVSLLAIGLAFLTQDVVEWSAFLLFYPAVTLSAWYGGLVPGLVAGLLAVVAADLLHTLAPRGLEPQLGPGTLHLAVFLLTAAMVSYLTESLRTARRDAEERAREADELAEELQDLALDLEQQIDQSRELVEMLAERNEDLAFARQQAEELAAEEEAARSRVMGMVADLSDGFVVCDLDWRVTYASPRTAALLCALRRTDRIVGHTLWSLLPGCPGTPFEERLRRAALREEDEEFEARIPSFGGPARVRVHAGSEGLYLCWQLAAEPEPRERGPRSAGWARSPAWPGWDRGVAAGAGEMLY